jgi:antitoxin MazE
MRIDVIQIGNSKGIRLPKSVLENCHIKDAVDLKIENESIILRSLQTAPRANWENAFQKMAEANDEQLLDHIEQITTWNESEWQW